MLVVSNVLEYPVGVVRRCWCKVLIYNFGWDVERSVPWPSTVTVVFLCLPCEFVPFFVCTARIE